MIGDMNVAKCHAILYQMASAKHRLLSTKNPPLWLIGSLNEALFRTQNLTQDLIKQKCYYARLRRNRE